MNIYANKNYFLSLFVCCLTFSIIIGGCSKKPVPSKKALEINGYSLTVGEFNELFNELPDQVKDTPEMRKEFLNRLITQKLILQEAQRQGLDKKKNFLKSIENFWEQSLLKIIIDQEIKEISQNIKVTDQEIQANYKTWVAKNPDDAQPLEKVRSTIEWFVLQERQSAAFEDWIETLKDNSKITINKEAIGIK